MLTPDEARERTADLVANALKAGASAADALYGCDRSTDVQMRLGKLEDVQSSESAHIGLRVFIGQCNASVSGSDLSPDGLAGLVERAVAMARAAPEDRYAGLAPEALLASGPAPALDIDDGADHDPAVLRDMALAVEDAARAVPGITNSEGGSASASRTVVALSTSHGFSQANRGTRYSCGASVLAGTSGAMERDHAFRSARHLADLEDPEAIGARAGRRAVARLGPQPIGGGVIPVVFDPRIGASLIGHLIGAISGGAIARKTSFLLDKKGAQLFDPALSIIDDPLRLRGLRSRWFDGEGVASVPLRLIDKGVLPGWLMDSASARQLGETPTGHAGRGGGVGASNVHLEGGSGTAAQLMSDIEHGIYVTDLIGHGVNPVTGDYSRGASGFAIKHGEIGAPVSEITIAGNLVDMFAALAASGDLAMHRAINVPTLRIDGMTVASG